MPAVAAAEAKRISLADFLESSSPGIEVRVDNLAVLRRYGEYAPELVLNISDIVLPCDHEKCEGKGGLHFAGPAYPPTLSRGKPIFQFIEYTCRNCQETTKTFAIAAQVDAEGLSGDALKFGEMPPFGPQTPARVITLIGPDREIFLSGRRAENQGLGIGAFAYYRRVVDNQKARIIQEMMKVATKLGASEAELKLFQAAAQENEFSAAVDKVKDAIPSALLVAGHNPLTLLYKALSDGLHERSDEECLECAREIRLVLTDLAERMAAVLREESELKGAVSKLLERVASKKPLAEKA